MVETRRGMRKKNEEISNPEASKSVEEDSATNAPVEEASGSNPAAEEASGTNPTLEVVGKQISASIPPLEEVNKDIEDGEAVIAAVLDSLRAEDLVQKAAEELASVGEGVRQAESVRVAPGANSEEESAEESVSLTSKNTVEDEDGGDGSGSSNREVEEEEEEPEGDKLDLPEPSMEEEEEEEQQGQEEDAEDESEHIVHMEANVSRNALALEAIIEL